MADEILIREKNFMKINAELDKKTKSVIEKAEIATSTENLSQISTMSSLKSSNLKKTEDYVEDEDINMSGRKSPTKKNNQKFKSNTIPRQFRDSLTTRKTSTNKKLLNIDLQLNEKLNNKFPSTTISEETYLLTPKSISPKSPKTSSVAETAAKLSAQPKSPQKSKNKFTIISPTTSPKKSVAKTSRQPKQSKDSVQSTLKSPNIIVGCKTVSKKVPSKSIEKSTNELSSELPIQDQIPATEPKSPKKINKTGKQQQQKLLKCLKSLNRKTDAVMEETFRNKNFSDNISMENLAVDAPTTVVAQLSEASSISKIENIASAMKKSCKSNFDSVDSIGVKKNLSPDGLIRFLKTKVTLLQDELETSSHMLTKRSKELEKSFEIQKQLETQRDLAISKNNVLTEHFEKIDEQLQASNRRLKEREIELISTNREMETLRRELKVLTQTSTNLEKRLYRANEELENSKNNLNILKNSEREIKDSTRIEKEVQEKQMKTMKKQRTDLLSAYKKQLFLIDNLKRQNACMEQAKMISFGEKEFTKVLEWNAKN